MSADWVSVCATGAIEPGMAGTVPVDGAPQGMDEIAIFHTIGGTFYALVNACPHKGGPLSQGIIHGDSVSCPLHNWRISLKSGEALGDDTGCTPTIPLKIEAGAIWLDRAAILARARA